MKKEKLKFQKKPVIVEAYQTDVEIIIDTLEGKMTASPGDWIITGVNGEQYPCKSDIFNKTYNKISSSSSTDIADKQFLMAQKILILLEQNKCNYRDWQFIDGLVNAVVNEQKSLQPIKYRGDLV